MRETWVPAAVCGIAFAVAQFAASKYVYAQLADICAALAGAGALVAVPHARVPAAEAVRASVLTGSRSEELEEADPPREVVSTGGTPVLLAGGQAATIGHFVSAAGAGLAFLPPVLDWFGVAVSGSDTRPTRCSGRCR